MENRFRGLHERNEGCCLDEDIEFFFLLTVDQHDIWSVLLALRSSKPRALYYSRRAEVDWAVYTDFFLSSDQC